jgi:hypothetical protein
MLANVSVSLFLFVCGCLMRPLAAVPCQGSLLKKSSEDQVLTPESDKLNKSSSYILTAEEVVEANYEINQDAAQADEDNLFITMIKSMKMFKVLNFSLLCLNNVLFMGALTIIWVHMHGHIIHAGLGDESDAGWVYCVIGVSNVLGRIFLGLICVNKNVSTTVLYTFGNFFLALTLLFTPFAQTFYGKPKKHTKSHFK